MQLEDVEGFDGAILLLTKGDEIHVRTTENISPMQFMELLMAVSLSIQGVLEESDDLINRTMH